MCCCGKEIKDHSDGELESMLNFKLENEDYETCAKIRDEVARRKKFKFIQFTYTGNPCNHYSQIKYED